MSGLLLMGVIAAWVAIVVFLAIRLARLFKPGAVRIIVVAMATAVLLALPVADELVSAPQFHKLCEEGTKLKFDPEKIRGRTIFLAENLQPRFTVGLLHGYVIPWDYLDATTKEKLITSNSYHLYGGLLIRALGISETNAPLTLRSYCASQVMVWKKEFLSRYDLKYVDRNVSKGAAKGTAKDAGVDYF